MIGFSLARDRAEVREMRSSDDAGPEVAQLKHDFTMQNVFWLMVFECSTHVLSFVYDCQHDSRSQSIRISERPEFEC